MKDNWTVNNTFIQSAPYTASRTLRREVQLINNVLGDGYRPIKQDQAWTRKGDEKWMHIILSGFRRS